MYVAHYPIYTVSCVIPYTRWHCAMLHSITLVRVTIIPVHAYMYRITLKLTNVALFYIVIWHVVSYHVPLIYRIALSIPKYPNVTVSLQLQIYIISFIPRSRYIAHFSARISHLTRHGVLINTHNTALYIAPRRICIIVPRNTHFCHLTLSLSLCVFNTQRRKDSMYDNSSGYS